MAHEIDVSRNYNKSIISVRVQAIDRDPYWQRRSHGWVANRPDLYRDLLNIRATSGWSHVPIVVYFYIVDKYLRVRTRRTEILAKYGKINAFVVFTTDVRARQDIRIENQRCREKRGRYRARRGNRFRGVDRADQCSAASAADVSCEASIRRDSERCSRTIIDRLYRRRTNRSAGTTAGGDCVSIDRKISVANRICR